MPVTRNIYEIYKNEPLLQEATRVLRTNIQFASVDKPIQSIVITSVTPSEGKTINTIALGISMAVAGKRTLLVDMDCHRPMLGNKLKIRPKFNLKHILYDNMAISEVVVPTILKNLFFLDVEPQMKHLAEVISSNKFNSMVSKLNSEYDIVIIDTPPLGMLIEAALLANRADGTILVLKSGQNDTKEVLDVISQLEKANAHILGVVLNDIRVTPNKNGYYYYNKGEDKHVESRKKRFGRKNEHSDISKTKGMIDYVG